MQVPTSEFPYYHRLAVQLRFGDIDMFDHVNNNAYFQYLDLGKTTYTNQVLKSSFDIKHHAMVIVNINCQFYASTYYDEEVEVLTRVHTVSQRSFIFEQRVVNPNTGSVKCIARSVMAGFDVVRKEGMEIPAAWREAMAAYEHRDFPAPAPK